MDCPHPLASPDERGHQLRRRPLLHCAEFALEPCPRFCALHWIGLAAIHAAQLTPARFLHEHKPHCLVAHRAERCSLQSKASLLVNIAHIPKVKGAVRPPIISAPRECVGVLDEGQCTCRIQEAPRDALSDVSVQMLKRTGPPD